MVRNLRLNLLVALFTAGFGHSMLAAESCFLVPVSLQQRVGQSSVVVEGKVLSSHSYWDHQHQTIYTAHAVKVLRLFKGELTASEIEIITEGGTVGNERITYSSTLQLSDGQYGIFFCKPAGRGITKTSSLAAFEVYSSTQGFIRYDLNVGRALEPFAEYQQIETARQAVQEITRLPVRELAKDGALTRATGVHAALKTTATPVIAGFAPAIVPAGIDALLTITGSNFGTVQGTGFVEFPNANDGGLSYVRPLATDYISWSDNQIVLRVPSSAVNPPGCVGTGNFRITNSDPATAVSSLPLTVPYAYTNFTNGGTTVRADLVNDNGSGGYSFQYNTSFAANIAATDAFQRALDTWCAVTVNWNVSGNTAINVIASDGVNVVRFDAGAELPAGVLGRLTSYYSGCGPVGGPFNWSVVEMDVAFDDAANWEFGPALPSFSEYDFESVALHELGHGLQLNHVINSSDVMHYSLTNGQTRRNLNADDATGGNYVVVSSTPPNSCGPAAMIPDLICLLPVKLLSFTGKMYEQKGTVLDWRVGDEKDIDGYEIARSLDGRSFEVIGFVSSHGNTADSYQFTDNMLADDVFYRLNVKEKSGAFFFSKTIHLRKRDVNVVSVYPNPANGFIKVTAQGNMLDHAVFVLTAADGRMMKKLPLKADGLFDNSISIDDLPAGVYFYQVETENNVFSGKLLKE